jgi:hypothetical protein
MKRAKETTPLEEVWIHEREQALAWLRLAFAVLAIVVIQYNPARVWLFPGLSFFTLASFLLYSISIIFLGRMNLVGSVRFIAMLTHWTFSDRPDPFSTGSCARHLHVLFISCHQRERTLGH